MRGEGQQQCSNIISGLQDKELCWVTEWVRKEFPCVEEGSHRVQRRRHHPGGWQFSWMGGNSLRTSSPSLLPRCTTLKLGRWWRQTVSWEHGAATELWTSRAIFYSIFIIACHLCIFVSYYAYHFRTPPWGQGYWSPGNNDIPAWGKRTYPEAPHGIRAGVSVRGKSFLAWLCMRSS